MSDFKKLKNEIDPYQEILDSPEVPFSLRWKIIKEIDRSNSFFFVFNLFMYQWKRYFSKLSIDPDDKVRVLEIGPGSGSLALKVLQWMLNKGLNVEYFLYDSQGDILEECYKRFNNFKNVKKIQATENYLKDFQDSEFDIIFSLHVLHHIQPKAAALDSINEMLRVSSKAVIIFDFQKQVRWLFRYWLLNIFIGGSKELRHDALNSLKRAYSILDIEGEVRSLCVARGYNLVVRKFKFFPYWLIYAYKES